MSGVKHNEHYYWTLYYRDTKKLAMCLRSTTEEHNIDQTTLLRMLNDLIKRKLIDDNIPLLRHRNVGYCEGWDTCIAFDICPCIEISVCELKWKWWQVIPYV